MYKILIVDDDPSIRQAIQIVLDIFTGWETLVAASGQEGLVIAQREQPDAILLDVMMPGMDGVTTLQYLQANPATQPIPVILFTSTAQILDRQQLAGLPITGIIPKPLAVTDLVEQLRSLLNWNE